MRALLSIRRVVCVAALAATAVAPAAAAATQIDVTALNGSFAGGDGGWSSTSACAPLCTVTNTVDGGPGASTPGSATAVYTTLAGLLGGLASGTSTWTSPGFTWANATPESAVLTFARRASIDSLLAAGGSAALRLQLRDQTTGTLTTLASDGISTADASFSTHSLPIDPSLLQPGAQLPAARDDELRRRRAAQQHPRLVRRHRAERDDCGGLNRRYPGRRRLQRSRRQRRERQSGLERCRDAGCRHRASPDGSGHRALLARPPGRGAGACDPCGQADRDLVVTLRMGTTVRRVVTGRDGYASLKLLRRVRSALRITFRAGSAGATTWARPR